MDGIDVKILNALINNSRCNASEISDIVGLSVSAVIERIKKLETSGIIKKYTVILDNALLGKDVSGLIMVSLDHPKYNEGFIKAVVEHDAICGYRHLSASAMPASSCCKREQDTLSRHSLLTPRLTVIRRGTGCGMDACPSLERAWMQ